VKQVGFVLLPFSFLLLGLNQAAKADMFVPGSTFTDYGENSPDSFSTTVTLASGTTSPDGGALNLTISEVMEGPDEWLVFDYQTASSGTQLVPNTSDDWEILQTGLDLAEPANFIGAFAEFLDSNGDSITPTDAAFPGYSVFANPVPGGAGTGQGAFFTAAVPAGPLPGLGAYLEPFDQLDGTGIPSADVEGFYQALEFAPATATPEPGSVVLICLGLLGVGLMRRLRHKQPIA
jgi:PEP-CTERM motif